MKFYILTVLTVIGPVFTAFLEMPAVKLALYYESRCIDSHDFVLNQLAPTYAKLGQYIDLELVPFGNENITIKNGIPVYTCQHGPEECWGNRIEACALAHSATEVEGLNFVTCMFTPDNWRDLESHSEDCAKQNNFDYLALQICNDYGQGQILIRANEEKTNSLNPKQSFIPWITVNGEHTGKIQAGALSHLEKFLCENYLQSVDECKGK